MARQTIGVFQLLGVVCQLLGAVRCFQPAGYEEFKRIGAQKWPDSNLSLQMAIKTNVRLCGHSSFH